MIRVFSFDYHPNDGGVSRLCAEIATRLARAGEIEVLTRHQSGDTNRSNVPPLPEIRVSTRRPVSELAAWWRLVSDRRQGTIIAGSWYSEGLVALLAGSRDLVVLAHGAELTPPRERWRRPIWAVIRRWTLQHARLVVANSQYTAGLVTATAPWATVRAIPLAVDHNRFTPGDRAAARDRIGVVAGAVVVGTVTRVQDFKGIDVVLRAIGSLPEVQRRRVLYFIGGKGPAVDALRQLASELRIGDQVRWLGFVPENDLPGLYRALDLFALCTRAEIERRRVEGFGLVFLEAQACGTPVVGTRTGGIPDAIHEGDGGWLIDQDDVKGLQDILAELVDHPERFAEQGRLARARVEREATWEHYMKRFEAAIGMTSGHD